MSEMDILVRLVVAAVCGGLIGMERERGDRPAGFRTYILVALGASLFSILSLVAFPASDTARVAAQIVVGIGFLGAGVIVVYGGTHVVGITTAATMWATAAVGMAAGAGYLVTAAYCTGISWWCSWPYPGSRAALSPVFRKGDCISRYRRLPAKAWWRRYRACWPPTASPSCS